MNLKTSSRLVDGVVIVDIVGELRLGEGTGILRDVIRDLSSKGYNHILLNLASVRHIDSSGVGELMSCFTSIRNQGGHLKLMNLNKNVHNLLQLTKLYTIFEVEEDEAAALKSFQ